MTATLTSQRAFWLLLIAASLTLSCGTGSRGPQPGTPAFYWAAAEQTFAAGDYLKTLDNLDRLTSTDSEYTAKAQNWALVLSSGMAHGYIELADAYEAGARANKANPSPFRRLTSTYRQFANRLALQFADRFAAFQAHKADTVLLAFPYPTGSPNPVATLARVANGILPPDEEVESAQKRVIQRSVLLEACRAAGAPQDPAKTQQLLKSAESKVGRPVFVTAMANSLFEQSSLYGRQKLDEPEKFKIFCGRAQEALKMLPDSKESKDLNSKIETALKRAKI